MKRKIEVECCEFCEEYQNLQPCAVCNKLTCHAHYRDYFCGSNGNPAVCMTCQKLPFDHVYTAVTQRGNVTGN